MSGGTQALVGGTLSPHPARNVEMLA